MGLPILFLLSVLVLGTVLGYFVVAWVGAVVSVLAYLCVPAGRKLMLDGSIKYLQSEPNWLSICIFMFLTVGISIAIIWSLASIRGNVFAAFLANIAGQFLVQSATLAYLLFLRRKGQLT